MCGYWFSCKSMLEHIWRHSRCINHTALWLFATQQQSQCNHIWTSESYRCRFSAFYLDWCAAFYWMYLCICVFVVSWWWGSSFCWIMKRLLPSLCKRVSIIHLYQSRERRPVTTWTWWRCFLEKCTFLKIPILDEANVSKHIQKLHFVMIFRKYSKTHSEMTICDDF